MRKTNENSGISRCSGFTLIELLVVISIIVLLIGILVPGMQAIKRLSKNLQQKSLFHSIEIGVELFSKDFGDYPDSERMEPTPSTGVLYYCGAQLLAEAMLGRDERGYEPIQDRKWYWPGDPAGTALDLYDFNTARSSNRRKNAYVELKDAGVYVPNEIYDTAVVTAGQLYSDAGDPLKPGERAPVFTDVFLRKKIIIAGETVKVGSPILYYKANRDSKLFKKTGPVGQDNTDKWIYNYKDNVDLIDLGVVGNDPTQKHLMDETLFYEEITNPGVSFDKPFNSTTFILISAGDDSIFGTKDDVTNFNY